MQADTAGNIKVEAKTTNYTVPDSDTKDAARLGGIKKPYSIEHMYSFPVELR